jgi:hypothetical protein
MNYFILLSLLCATTIYTADQREMATVYVVPENPKDFKPFEYEAAADEFVWDAARAITIKHGLTVTGLCYYEMPNDKEPITVDPRVNYRLQWHQEMGAPLHILAKRNKTP